MKLVALVPLLLYQSTVFAIVVNTKSDEGSVLELSGTGLEDDYDPYMYYDDFDKIGPLILKSAKETKDHKDFQKSSAKHDHSIKKPAEKTEAVAKNSERKATDKEPAKDGSKHVHQAHKTDKHSLSSTKKGHTTEGPLQKTEVVGKQSEKKAKVEEAVKNGSKNMHQVHKKDHHTHHGIDTKKATKESTHVKHDKMKHSKTTTDSAKASAKISATASVNVSASASGSGSSKASGTDRHRLTTTKKGHTGEAKHKLTISGHTKHDHSVKKSSQKTVTVAKKSEKKAKVKDAAKHGSKHAHHVHKKDKHIHHDKDTKKATKGSTQKKHDKKKHSKTTTHSGASARASASVSANGSAKAAAEVDKEKKADSCPDGRVRKGFWCVVD